jgi:catechol 2,3-dioxygenase-like lactoylglutathione lyase family enzyme
MKMHALNHVNLVVENVEKSAAFYESLFGLTRLWKEGDFIFLQCGNTDLGLVQGNPIMHPRFHVGFRVASRDEVTQWLARVTDAGAPVTYGPKDYGAYYTFTCRDPSGYGVEVYFEGEPRGRAGFPDME